MVLANIWTTWISEIAARRVWGKYFGSEKHLIIGDKTS